MQTASIFILLASITPILSSRILQISAINASSHHMWSTFLATELAKRGHEITYVAVRQHSKPPLHPNIKLLVHQQSEESIKTWDDTFYIDKGATPQERFKKLENSMVVDCKHMYENGPMKDLIDPRNNDTYDLLLMEYAGHDCMMPLSQRFGSPPVVLTNPVTNNPHWLLRTAGVPIFHMTPYTAEDIVPTYGIWDRLNSLKLYLQNDLYYFWKVRPAMEEMNKKYFGEDVLSVKELFEKVSLYLINIPVWMTKIPLTSNVVPVGGIHLADPKPLTPELQKFMDGAENGVILISFGTLLPTKDLAPDNLRMIASALGKLPQRVLWKWDPQMNADNITFPENIWRLPWIPQMDVLGHPNMRLFVSHCGGQSSLEAMFHGVPVLAVPGFWDQNGNANSLVAEKAAIRLNFRDITEETFLETVQELILNPTYSEGALRLKNALRDQPLSPLERSIFWIEYVIRHGGAPHLRPLLYNLPYQHLLMLDIVLVSIASVIILLVIFKISLFLLRSLKNCFAEMPKNKSD